MSRALKSPHALARLRPALLGGLCLLSSVGAGAQNVPPAAASAPAAAPAAAPAVRAAPVVPQRVLRGQDFIVAVVGTELVTNGEVAQRLQNTQREAARNGQAVPPRDELRQQLLDSLIDERAQLAYARESGFKIEDSDLDRAVANVAAANRLTLPQLRQRVQADGLDWERFRANLRDQMMLERVREREVQSRIKISDADIDRVVDARKSGVAPSEFNIAQILVRVPEGASEAEVAERRLVAEKALSRARAGEPFEKLVAELSQGPQDQGGAIGIRPADRLPDLFVDAVRDLRSGEVVPVLVRSGAGFHVIKLLERKDGGMTVQQTRARHILLRTGPQLTSAQASARLADVRRQIVGGRLSFQQAARDISEDGSAPQGGELGWASPGQFVPEFEEAMNKLAIDQISEPVVTRFGVHLIQPVERRATVVDRKQMRDMARNVLREQKFETAYSDWSREVRARAYVELREPPQ
ncbi:peptidylprolyl isomerase [Rivibacter subsaxonicus]|nr:peptidylprolyl isomerase [Rivibacter subsaxonicus]